MTKVFTGIANFGKALSQINDSHLPRPMRAQVRRSAIWLVAARFLPLGNPTKLAGFSVSYFRAPELRYLFREIFVEGSYLFHAGNDQPLILDCGSNIGMSVLFFKKLYPNARIMAFEPDPDNFGKLTENVERNQLQNVTLQHCALSDQDGTVDLFQAQGSLVSSTLKERASGRKIVVPARRLSAFITEPVDFLKMDIEGAEELVLPELAAAGKLGLIKQMCIEYHHHVARDVDRMSSILKLLEDGGFGYQLGAPTSPGKSPAPRVFEDIAIYGYRKADASGIESGTLPWGGAGAA